MKINKNDLRSFWFTDKNGNFIGETKFEAETHNCEVFYVSRFPTKLITQHYRVSLQSEVDACKHPRKFIKPTYGLCDGLVGRKCELCHGTQVKNKWTLWPKKWDGDAFHPILETSSTYDDTIILKMANSGDYTLGEAILLYTSACERCMNVLAHKYTNGEEGYLEYSDEWKLANTNCKFCEDVSKPNVEKIEGEG